MTNKDKSTEKIRELIGTRKIYRVYYTISEELHCIYVAAYEEELSLHILPYPYRGKDTRGAAEQCLGESKQ